MNAQVLLQIIPAVRYISTARQGTRVCVCARAHMLAFNVAHQLCFASKCACVITVLPTT